jgi:transcriptional regulator with XRE-family HTH domain
MGAREDQRRRRAKAREVRTRVGMDLRRLRHDTGLTLNAVASAAGISESHLCGIELGRAESSQRVLVSIADVLGADLSVRFYPGTGPRIHDHIQARIVETLIAVARPRWGSYVEVPVHRPARGYIDLVLSDEPARHLVATEAHSDLRRIEQQLRWAHEKAESLPSSDLWRRFSTPPTVGSLLILRSTTRTRTLVQELSETFATTYPAKTRDVYDAVTGAGSWPGDGLLWARVEGKTCELLDTPPRGVSFGR